MAFFSERAGLEKKLPLQVDRIEQGLRNRLWTVFDIYFFRDWSDSDWRLGTSTLLAREIQAVMQVLWDKFFKQPIDRYPGAHEFMKTLRASVLEQQPWHKVYNALEVYLAAMPEKTRAAVTAGANQVLDEENSGYRIVDGQFVPITSADEMKTVEEAVSVKLEPVQSHLRAAIGFLGIGEKRDYRNSIKESVSAVESLCRLITKKTNFGDALKELQKKIRIHPALGNAFSALYGYTSDEGGVRHALLDKEKVSGPEARFMLICCSAFINYVVASLVEAGHSF